MPLLVITRFGVGIKSSLIRSLSTSNASGIVMPLLYWSMSIPIVRICFKFFVLRLNLSKAFKLMYWLGFPLVSLINRFLSFKPCHVDVLKSDVTATYPALLSGLNHKSDQ